MRPSLEPLYDAGAVYAHLVLTILVRAKAYTGTIVTLLTHSPLRTPATLQQRRTVS